MPEREHGPSGWAWVEPAKIPPSELALAVPAPEHMLSGILRKTLTVEASQTMATGCCQLVIPKRHSGD